MKIGISSNVRFSIPLERCVESLIEAGFSTDDVYVFVGGCEAYARRAGPCGVHAFSVPHNSFDFTAMISVLDLGLEDTWVFVHDTITANSKFADVVRAVTANARFTSDGPSMNMGVFTWEKLEEIRNDLEKFRNATKKACVDFEDVFLGGCEALNSTPREVQGKQDVYGTGTQRIVEYYPDVGVYKYKSNWYVKDAYHVDP